MSEPRTPYITGNDPRGYDKHGSERGARTPRDNNRAAAVLMHMAGVEPLPTPPTAAERLAALDIGAEALRHYIDPDKAVEWLRNNYTPPAYGDMDEVDEFINRFKKAMLRWN